MTKYALAVIGNKYYATEKEAEFTDEPASIGFITLPNDFYTGDTTFEDVVNEFVRIASEKYDQISDNEQEDDMIENLLESKEFYPDVITPDCCDSYVYSDTSYAFKILDAIELISFKHKITEENMKYIKKFQKRIRNINTFGL